jgi:hypothetical protein
VSIEAVDQRRCAILAILAEEPGLNQREIANRAGCSQRTVGRDLIAMRQDADSARAAAAQPVPPPDPVTASPGADCEPPPPREPSQVGRVFIETMDAELADVAERLGSEVAWTPAERELLATIAADMDRRADLHVAWLACQDPGSDRSLKLSSELRLLGGAITKNVKLIQGGIDALVKQQQRQAEPEQPAAPPSVVSLKARAAANTRWQRHRMRQGGAG